ncbi:MAG TPA: ribbon-helix-helix protein, CopG family [Candidatus Desulfofervidus auxilii]|uniref:Ribbon-helix-helix protein, CopG family n=1 Tax=Desulfofervidus auxilii TaxID=1621989 RepID=A0A7C0Y239_DESA2|nr:ribbon-helix-helix protein, CopG family [Candidatus Desulfofervidus auxilii]
MKRTQIYLDDTLYMVLKEKSKRSKKSISEVIRESLRKVLFPKSELLIKNMEGIFGLWSDRKALDPDQYVREIRKGNRLDSFGY